MMANVYLPNGQLAQPGSIYFEFFRLLALLGKGA